MSVGNKPNSATYYQKSEGFDATSEPSHFYTLTLTQPSHILHPMHQVQPLAIGQKWVVRVDAEAKFVDAR